jgi:uncharacterized protein
MDSKVIIAGGTGLIGKYLKEFLTFRGYRVIILSRSAAGNPDTLIWDGINQGSWSQELNGAKAVINLSGKSINCRPTPANKTEILSSRIKPTLAIGEAIRSLSSPPDVWLNASAVGYYGDTGNRPVTEGAEPGNDFIADVCVQWEKAMFSTSLPSTRQVALRIGMVLSRQGGALPQLLRFARLGLGGTAGRGNQHIAWIHLHDLAAAIHFIISNGTIAGPVNIVSPQSPVNSGFMKKIRKSAGAWIGLPQPSFMLIPGAWVIGTNPDLVLNSSFVLPEVLKAKKFSFQYADLEEALDSKQ